MQELPDLLSELAASGLDPELLIKVTQRLVYQETQLDALELRRLNDKMRKRQQRERQGIVTDVTISADVTGRHRTSQDNAEQAEKHHNGTAQQTSMIAVKEERKKVLRDRGTRIAADWVLPAEWLQWALQKGVAESRVQHQALVFKNYWVSVAGEKGVKRDWRATWHNWILKDLERTGIPVVEAKPDKWAEMGRLELERRRKLKEAQNGHPQKSFTLDGGSTEIHTSPSEGATTPDDLSRH